MGEYKACQPTRTRDSGEEVIKGDWKRLWRNYCWKLPKPKEGNISRYRKHKRVPNKLNPNRPTPRHIIIKMVEVTDKERILKAIREKQRFNYKGTPIRLSANFSTEALQVRGSDEIYSKSWKGKSKVTQPSKIRNIRTGKEFLRPAKKKKMIEYTTLNYPKGKTERYSLNGKETRGYKKEKNHSWKVNHLSQYTD